MMEIILIIIAFLLLILAVIWLPFFKQLLTKNTPAVTDNLRDDTNVRLYQEHKAEIEKDYTQGSIDEENYQYLLAELDNSLLQDIEANAEQSAKAPSLKQFSMLWPLVLTIFVLGFTITLYNKNGAYERITAPPTASATESHQNLDDQQQMMVRIKQLQQKAEQNPENSEAWYSLGQVLVGAGDFDGALAAFDKVIAIEGVHADLIGAKAQAVYYRNNQKINDEVQGLIDQALALDPLDPSTNILLGMHNFISQNYQEAINYWQKVLDTNRQNVNAAALQQAVEEAKSRMGLASAPVEADVSGPQLSVHVSLSAEIEAKLAEGDDKVVFIYAIPTDGRRMPLAAMKVMASSLPTTVVLSNKNAMSPQANLSSVDSVHIYAIVSNQGGAGIKPGDYKAEANAISVDHTETINLVVDHLVK